MTKRNKGTTFFPVGGRKNVSLGVRGCLSCQLRDIISSSLLIFYRYSPKKLYIFSPKAAEKMPPHGMTARTKLNPNAQHGARCTGVAQLMGIIFLR